jgi:hypothetical protein
MNFSQSDSENKAKLLSAQQNAQTEEGRGGKEFV